MQALHRKLLRDLWHIKGQVLAISLVIAAAVSVYVMYLGAFESLRLTQSAYYNKYRFADIFASLKRGPMSLEKQIREIPGVSQVALRVSAAVTLNIPDMTEPAMGRLVSIPAQRQPMLNDIFIRRGRYIDPERRSEILVNEGFALAHQLAPGDTISAVINGRLRRLEIAGIALSPEYVYTIRPGEIVPDDRRYGILWMNRDELAAAFDMSGGFNDVALSLMPGVSEKDVIAALDRLLDRYGGLGATSRSLQLSNWYLNNELTQLQNFGTVIPIIFLAVAAFLLNVVLGRIVSVQREQIAALKALGYTNTEVGVHYYQWGIAVAFLGIAIGLASGIWLASSLVRIYNNFFRFPVLEFRIAPHILATAILVSIVTALLGTRGAVRRAVKLPPAEAMRPQAPAHYRVSLIERMGLGAWLSPTTRMIVRNISRRPFRSALSTIGIAFGGAMVVMGMFFLDAMTYSMDIQFNVAQRQDLTVAFVEPVSSRAFYELTKLDGVMAAEPLRSVPVRLRFGQRSRQTAITGLEDNADLNRVIDSRLRPVTIPPDGIVLSTKMAEILGAAAGDRVEMDVLEGERPHREVVVAAVAEEFMGASVYMNIDSLHRLMRESRTLSGAFMQVDESQLDNIYARLKAIPAVAAVALKQATIRSFKQTIEQNLAVMIFFNQIFSSIIAFGVIYNAARISLSERNWELASLRVMGFTRGEIAHILLGEFAVLTVIAIPLGLAIGYVLAALTVATVGDTELYRIPLVIAPSTYGAAAASVIAAAVISGLVVRRRLNNLDLVAVLKTRE
jgi:putative ABC transport system permease protein